MRVSLQTHDGKEYVEYIEDFNLTEFVNEVNSETHKMIIFGSIALSKNLIKLVDTNPVVDEESAE